MGMNSYDFIILLMERTKSQLIQWEQTSKDDEFVAILNGYCVTVGNDYDDYNNIDGTFISIENNTGTIIDRIVSQDLDITNASDFLNALHSQIRRQAMGVDEAYKSLANALDYSQPEIDKLKEQYKMLYNIKQRTTEIEEDDIPF